MDYLACEVRLGGNVQNTVWRRGVTPAEIEVLRAKHGADAVVNISVISTTDDEPSPASIRESLVAKYGKVVYDLFPGVRPNVPLTAEEVGVVTEAKPKRASAAKPVVVKEPEPELVEDEADEEPEETPVQEAKPVKLPTPKKSAPTARLS